MKIKIIFFLFITNLAWADEFLEPHELFERSLAIFQIAIKDIHREHGYTTENNIRYFDRVDESACDDIKAFAIKVNKENISLDRRRITYIFYRCGNEFNRLHLMFSGQWESLEIIEDDFFLFGFYESLPAYARLESTAYPRVLTMYDGENNFSSYIATYMSGDVVRVELRSINEGSIKSIALRVSSNNKPDTDWLLEYDMQPEYFRYIKYLRDQEPVSARLYQLARTEILQIPTDVFFEVLRIPGFGYIGFNPQLLM